MKKYFITGIDTDSGKTIASAIITQKLQADYWKPVQAGSPTDSDTLRSLISPDLIVHPEGEYLEAPMSPHAAAKLENREIGLAGLNLPDTQNTLVIEGAGGIMVPLNDQEMVIQVAKKFECEVILVSRIYLGSINHTLLSIDYLQRNNYKIAGVLFNGETNPETERIIQEYTGVKSIGRINHLEEVTPETIITEGQNIQL